MNLETTVETLEQLSEHLIKRLNEYKESATELNACLYCECRVGPELCPKCLDAREKFNKIRKNE